MDTLAASSTVNHGSGLIELARNSVRGDERAFSADALIIGFAMATFVKSRWAAVLWTLWPTWVWFSVMATGNHYWPSRPASASRWSAERWSRGASAAPHGGRACSHRRSPLPALTVALGASRWSTEQAEPPRRDLPGRGSPRGEPVGRGPRADETHARRAHDLGRRALYRRRGRRLLRVRHAVALHPRRRALRDRERARHPRRRASPAGAARARPSAPSSTRPSTASASSSCSP